MRNCSNLLSLPAHKRKKKIFVPLPAESFTFTTTKQPNSQKTAGRWQETKGSKISLEDGPSPRRERENPSHGLSSHKEQQYYNFPLGKIQKPHPRVLSSYPQISWPGSGQHPTYRDANQPARTELGASFEPGQHICILNCSIQEVISFPRE